MKKLVIVILLIGIAFLLGFVLFREYSVTGKAVDSSFEGNYSWTKAICNDKNQCIDVVIYCSGDKVVKIEPKSDLVNYSESWEHPNRDSIGEFCK